jgi:N-acyl-D-amino-acid deacylase
MRQPSALLLGAALAITLVLASRLPTQAQVTDHFDLLIVNGQVMDGTGNPWFRADIGVLDGRIAAVGMLRDATAARTIDARGQMVVPGFIDIHSHADDGSRGATESGLRSRNARVRAAPNLVAQGITTVVVNHDGRSPWPIMEQRALIEQRRIGPNAMLMVGHGEVRSQVMGSDVRRPARAVEITAMRALVRQAMEEGAVGLSAGLEYAPGRWSTTDEVVALTEEIVPFGGVYISHERSEGADPMWYWPSRDPLGPPTLLDAVRETIEIGERTGAVVVASHIKAKGANYWGTGSAAIQLIERARARGVQIFADQYPYETSGTDGNTVLIPGWALERAAPGESGRADYPARLRAVLADSTAASDLRGDIAHEIQRRGGADRVLVFDHRDTTMVGKTLGQLATARGIGEVEMAIALQMEGYPDRRGGGRTRGFSLSELDIDMYAARPWVATATDGGIALPDGSPSTHARFYGSFPRKIRHFALDRGVITVEDAIRSSTSLPAQIMGLRDRGVIREGNHADLVVLDLSTVRDRATFTDPHQYPEGIVHVLVGGIPVVDKGELTWALPGKVITHSQAKPVVPPRQ